MPKPDHRHSSMDAGIQCQGWHYIEHIPVTGFWHPCQNDVLYSADKTNSFKTSDN